MKTKIKAAVVCGALALTALVAPTSESRAHDNQRFLVVKGPIAAGVTVSESRGVRVLRPVTENTLVLIDTGSGRSWTLSEGMVWTPVPFANPANDVPVSVFKPLLLNP